MRTIQLVGRLTADPTFDVKGGKELCEFSVAVTDEFDRDKAHFYQVKAWGKRGEVIANNFKKGKEIALTGKLDHERWEKDGQKFSRHTVNLDNFGFVGKKDD